MLLQGPADNNSNPPNKDSILANRATRTSAKKKAPAAVETSESIAEQTRLYLKSGKKIEVVESGISGQPTLASGKQINLGNSRRA
jgi:hypothetical protein